MVYVTRLGTAARPIRKAAAFKMCYIWGLPADVTQSAGPGASAAAEGCVTSVDVTQIARQDLAAAPAECVTLVISGDV